MFVICYEKNINNYINYKIVIYVLEARRALAQPFWGTSRLLPDGDISDTV